MNSLPTVSVIVPVYWPDEHWPRFLTNFAEQTIRPKDSLALISGADSISISQAENCGFRCITVDPQQFDHGGTRQLGVDAIANNTEIVVFLTQDACLATKDSIECLIQAFCDPDVAVAWGRQIPHGNANPMASHARLYNYPTASRTVDFRDVEKLGIKAAFCSDSFAAYRVSALREIGGFPKPVVLGEDMSVAAKALKSGYRVRYVAEATVFHSHNYTGAQEFARYFDTGAFHAANDWLLKEFGNPTGEGKNFVLSEIFYLLSHAPLLIPKSLFSNACKFIGYKLGKNFQALPKRWPQRIGMNKTYWKHWHEEQIRPGSN